MAESDDKLARSYRALGREEPPPALDAAILAAARESVRPRARNRWAGPVSIAAVLVLGLGISLRMQLEQPGIESSLPAPAPTVKEAPSAPIVKEAPSAPPAKETPPEARAKDASAPRAKAFALPAGEADKNVASAPPLPEKGPKLSRPVEEPAAAGAERFRQQDAAAPEALAKKRDDTRAAEATRAEARPFTEPQAPPPAAALAPAPQAAPPPPPPAPQSMAPASPATPSAATPAPMRAKREAAAGAVAQDSARPADADERVTELERIARLRRDGRDADADKALEDFRRRNPDYRIPEAMWERVRPR